jgi:hypothetical protein
MTETQDRIGKAVKNMNTTTGSNFKKGKKSKGDNELVKIDEVESPSPNPVKNEDDEGRSKLDLSANAPDEAMRETMYDEEQGHLKKRLWHGVSKDDRQRRAVYL